jgi:hypothetical protein
MTARPRLVRSVPYWVLVVGSLAVGAVGLWLTLDKLGVMTATLADGSATGVEVYAGQSWAILGSIMIGAGVVGLALALTLAAAASLVKRDEPVVVLADSFDDDSAIDDSANNDSAAADAVDEVIVDSSPETVTASGVSADEAALDSDAGVPADEQVASAKN